MVVKKIVSVYLSEAVVEAIHMVTYQPKEVDKKAETISILHQIHVTRAHPFREFLHLQYMLLEANKFDATAVPFHFLT